MRKRLDIPVEEQSALKAFLTELPKTEIHLHIEGLVSADSIWSLIQKHKLDLGISSKAELQERFNISSLNEFIDLFMNIVQACFLEEEDLSFLIEDARHYLGRNNIKYAEIFIAPTKLIKNGLDFKAIVDTLDRGAQSLAKDGFQVRFLVDVSRGFGPENAMKNLDLTLNHGTSAFIGVGLGGAEQSGPAREYQPVFEKAIQEGLHVVAHAGEDVGPESIWDTINHLQVERIGHGISAIKDQDLMDELRERRIPLEICPTSNLFTRKFATSLENHPLRAFFDHGILVTVNTDDPTLFGVELNEEYYQLLDRNIFTLREIFKIVKNGVYATFLSEDEKEQLWSEVVSFVRKSDYASELEHLL
jgi:adenosine deaminase